MRPSPVALIGALALAALATSTGGASAQSDNGPLRSWSFTESRKAQSDVLVDGATQQGGRLDVSHDFGPALIEFPFESPDGLATGRITSSASGATFDVEARSPTGTQRGSAIGGTSHLDQSRSYEKTGDGASMRITISKAFIAALDSNGGLLPTECPPGLACLPEVGKVTFTARAYSANGEFFRVGGVAFIAGHQGNWTIDAVTQGSSAFPSWSRSMFERDVDRSGQTATAGLTRPLTMDVDLSSLGDGELFAVQVSLDAAAIDGRGRESAVVASIRDPQRGPTALVQTTGLIARGAVSIDEPPIETPAPVECPLGPDPRSGELQLSAPAYVTDESAAAGPFVLVTRTGGSAGAASATVTTGGASAQAGADYTDVGTTVVFQDGDRSPRLVEIPILQDERSESDETFDIALTDPSCAALGDQAVAEVTIADDDRPVEPADSFTIGGTVDGLEGSGLVLANLGSELPIDANGAFAFPEPMPDGIPYHVSVSRQPSVPQQVCTITNGEGTISEADVTDVAVRCSTPPATSGLDLTFDGDGKVSTLVAGNHVEAVAVQGDGMIVSAGGGSGVTLTRHDAAGVLDPTFGDNGIVTTDLGGTDLAMDVALQPGDGKIVVAGRSDDDFAVARNLPNGTPDGDFGTDGVVRTDFNGGFDAANGVAIDSQGRIVAGGNAHVSKGPGLGFQNDVAVARYTPDGQPDTSFGGGDGRTTTDLGTDTDLGNDVAVDAQDRIVMAGQVDQSSESAILRYDTDGDVDTTFGGGPVITGLGAAAVFKGVAIRPADGTIVLAGSAAGGVNESDFALAMLNDDGQLDTSIGNAGLVTTDVSPGQAFADDFAEDLAIQADGKIVLAGRNTSTTFNDLAIVRYTADGDLDTTFAGDGQGILITDFHGASDRGNDVAIGPDGKAVVAVDASNGGSFALVRALP